jgi:tetratricopeptide (TPR) repeat protein
MLPFIELNVLGTTATPAQMNDLVNPKSISDLATGLNATLDFEKKSGKPIFTNDIAETIKSFQPMFLNYAIDLGNQKKYRESASVLYSLYQLNKKDQEKLYYAANYAFNASDYDSSLQYYNELIALNYSGEGTAYWAKNIASGKEEYFNSKSDRDRFFALKTHNTPRDEKIPSKRGEIYKNIVYIYTQKGKIEEAKKAVVEAKKNNPQDTSLLLTEANLYLETKDFITYKKLI